MQRIVIDARESGTTSGRYVDKLIENLHSLSVPYEVILLAKPHRLSFLEKIAPTYRLIECRYKEFTFGEQFGLWRQIRHLKPDLMFFPMVQQPILYWGKVVTMMQDLTTVRFKNPVKNPVVFWVKQQVYKVVNLVVAKKSARLLCFSQYVRDDVAQYTHVPKSKITVTPLAADKITDSPDPMAKLAGKKFLLSVGRPLPHKNIPRLIDAFVLLQAKNPDLLLVLAGKTDRGYRQLQELVAQRGVKGVVFTDFVSEGQLRWLYENAQVYVFPSLSEGFGLPGLEAMQYDLPVASSNATCLPEVYKDAAQYFNPFSASHMAAKIQQILDEPKLAHKLTQNGRVLLKNYSWKTMAKKTMAVFEAALNK